MTCRILQSALLSLSVSLTGCVAYEMEERGYAAPSYSSYGYQQPTYPIVRYREYAPVQEYRYPARTPSVYIYRQPVQRYRAPVWRGYSRYDRAEVYHHDYNPRSWQQQRYDRGERHERHEHQERHERRERGHDNGRGWEVRRY